MSGKTEASRAPKGKDEGKKDGQKAASAADERIAQLEEELVEANDKFVRLFAEFENARKRNERERQEFAKYATEGLITEFLGVVDDLDRTVQVANEKHQNYENFLKGVEMVMARVHELLRKQGVKPIEAAGKPFDPHCHEILLQEPSDEVEEGTVLEEFQKGYLLGDRVVRTAKVKVAVAKPPVQDNAPPEADESQDGS